MCCMPSMSKKTAFVQPSWYTVLDSLTSIQQSADSHTCAYVHCTTHSGFISDLLRPSDAEKLFRHCSYTVLLACLQTVWQTVHSMVMQDVTVRNAMMTFLVAVAQTTLPNATADVAVLNNFTVSLSASDSIDQTSLLSGTHTAALTGKLLSFIPASNCCASCHLCNQVTPGTSVRFNTSAIIL